MYEELVDRLRNLSHFEIKNAESVIHVSAASVTELREIAKEAADAIEELQRQIDAWVETERKALIKSLPKWISVAERLPDEDDLYLVCGVWGSGKQVVDTCEYKVHDGYFSAAWNFDVTHWMPLPQPPKEET